MFTRIRFINCLIIKATASPELAELRKHFEVAHKILLIYAVGFATIMIILLGLWKAAQNNAEIAKGLHVLACIYEASEGIPTSSAQFEKECPPKLVAI